MSAKKRFKTAFSVLSWNVRHFGRSIEGGKERSIAHVVEVIGRQNADVLAIYEVIGSRVFPELMKRLSNYQFFVTEGPQSQEILVGVKRRLPAFFTQRLEFQSGQSSLRPGALVTIQTRGQYYTLLFLHLKSFTDPKGFGIRDDMLDRALRFRTVLDEKAKEVGQDQANYIFLGDLNTMGLDLTYSDAEVSAETEVDRLKERAARRGMRLLEKDAPATFWPGSRSELPMGDLDHVVASDHLHIRGGNRAPVAVRGWPSCGSDEVRDEWRERLSDHAMIWFRVGAV